MATVTMDKQTTSGTVREVLNVLQMCKIASRDWHNGIKKRRDMYNFRHYKKRAKAYEDRFSDPTPTSTVDMAVSVIMTGDLSFTAKGFTPTQSEEAESGRVEKMLTGLLQINNEREESNLIYDIVLNFVRDGAAVLYTVWDTELETLSKASVDFPGPDGTPIPLNIYTDPPVRIQALDPLNIHLLPGGPYRWAAVCREEDMTVFDVEARFGVKIAKYADKNIREKQLTKDKIVDMWRLVRREEPTEDRGTRVFYVVESATVFAGQAIYELREMEGYEDLPFTVGFFKPTGKGGSDEWGHGILDPMFTTLEHLEKSINRRARQILLLSSMAPVLRVQADRHIQLPAIMGNPIRLGPGEEFNFPQWPGNPPDVNHHISYLQDRMRMTGFTEAFYGIGGEGLSGYALSRLSDVNKLKIEVPLKNLELLFTLWAKKTLRLMVKLAGGEVVRVYGRLRGKDFVEQIVGHDMANYFVKATLRAKFPGDEVRDHAMGTQSRGLLSDLTIMERYMGVEQPDDERSKRMRELAQTHPVMQQYAIMSALLEMALDGDEAAALALQTMQQQQAMGGQQPEPSPMQPTGMPSSTGEPTRQEQGFGTAQEEKMTLPLGGRPTLGV